MGEEDGALDIERRGSSSRRRGGSHRGVHPAPPPHYNTDGRPTEFSGPPRNPDLVIRDHRKFFSWLVPSFIIANVTLFVVTMYYNDCPKLSPASKCVAPFLKRFSFQPFSENPLLGPSSVTLEKMGALVISKVIHDNQGWRLISCIWLHAGVFHLLANMLSLLFIGIRLEQEFGFLRIGTVYLLSGFGGSLLSALFIQDRISVGASGALFGLLGAMLSELITNWTIYANKCAALTTLIVIVALNLAVGLLPHVDNFAHIGGFVSGFFLGFVFLMKPQYGWINRKEIPPGYEVESPVKSKHKAYQYVFLMVSFLILVAGFTAAVVMVFRGYNVNKHCSWCHYLSCVPTSKWSCNESASCQSYYSDNTNNTLVLSCQSNNKTQTYVGLDQSNSTLSQLCIQLCA